DGAQEPAGDTGAQCKFGHPHHVLARSDRHDTGDDRYTDSGQLAALAEVVEVMVDEEELGADVVGSGVDLALEKVELVQAVRCARMSFGKTGDADSKAARIGEVRARAYKPHELFCV